MKSIFRYVATCLIAIGFVVTFLFADAELKRREDAEIAQMFKQQRAEQISRMYGDLDVRAKYLVAYDEIKK